MSRKPRFKVQLRNPLDRLTIECFGRKQWVSVFPDDQRLGYVLTFDEATFLYWKMVARHPEVTYRIVERR